MRTSQIVEIIVRDFKIKIPTKFSKQFVLKFFPKQQIIKDLNQWNNGDLDRREETEGSSDFVAVEERRDCRRVSGIRMFNIFNIFVTLQSILTD